MQAGRIVCYLLSIRNGVPFCSPVGIRPGTIGGMRNSSQSQIDFMRNIWWPLRRRKRTMAKNFKELQAKMSPERRARNEAAAAKMIDEMALDELREARDLTQEQLARLLHVNQAAVSKMERRADMYITTLQGAIKAMGGRLEIRAVFPNGVVRISQFQDLRKRA